MKNNIRNLFIVSSQNLIFLEDKGEKNRNFFYMTDFVIN